MDKVEHRQLEKQVKQDIKGHDKFVTAVDSAWDRIAKHKLLVAGAVGLAIVAGAGVTITSHFSEKEKTRHNPNCSWLSTNWKQLARS